MATFKTLIRPEQKKADGTFNVKIRITHNRKTKYISTPFFVTEKEISKRKKNGREEIRIKNQSIIDKTDEIIVDYKKKIVSLGMGVDALDVDSLIKRLTSSGSVFKLDIIKYGHEYVNRLNEQGKVSTAKSYQSAINALIRFVGRDNLDISEITVNFLQSYERFIEHEPKLTGSHLSAKPKEHKQRKGRVKSLYLARLKTIHGAAKMEFNDEESGVINIPYSPFAKYTIPSSPRTESRVLTIQQMQKIIDMPYAEHKRRGFSTFNISKDLFLISFSLMGVNMADIYEAEPIQDDIFAYNRKKTRTRRKDGAMMKVRIEPKIKPLLGKYIGSDKSFVFSKCYNTANIMSSIVNKGLKDIGKMIGVPNLTFYHARHTMASICANKLGIDIARVDEMLNHSDPKLAIARVYIEKDFTPLWEANRKLIDLFDWSFYEE